MNKHLIEVRYIPATGSKPARVSLTSHSDESQIIFPCCSRHLWKREAEFKLEKMGFTLECGGDMKRGYFIIVNEFKSLKGN